MTVTVGIMGNAIFPVMMLAFDSDSVWLRDGLGGEGGGAGDESMLGNYFYKQFEARLSHTSLPHLIVVLPYHSPSQLSLPNCSLPHCSLSLDPPHSLEAAF